MDDVTAAQVADDWRSLCLFLGGAEDSFTGLLLRLVVKADPGNRARLREAFPREVAAWEEWCQHAPLSWGDLDRLTAARMERPWSDPAHRECGGIEADATPAEAPAEDSAGLEAGGEDEAASGGGFDDLPAETRREVLGWFGEPWPSGICYAEDGRLLEEMRKPFPAGESCLYCEEPFDEAAGDSGKAIPQFGGDSALAEVRHAHKECLLMQFTGSLAHHEGYCQCHGGDGTMPGMTVRQEALEVWRRYEAKGPRP